MTRPIVVVVLLLLLALASPAFAHAALLAADPVDGAVVAAAPATLTLKFDEQVAPVALRLIEPDGRGLVLDQFSLDGASVVIVTPPGLGSGSYALSWRVISADGHPVGGTTGFSIGAPSAGGAPTETESIDWPVRTGIWATRVLTYVGLLVGIGGVFFARWVGRSAIGLPATRGALVAGLVALLPAIAFQGLDALDAPIGSLFAGNVWREGLASSFGWSVGLAALAMLLALFATVSIPAKRALSLVAFIAAGLTLAVTGHAATGDPQWLTRPAVFVHTLGAAFWAGSLLPLMLLLRVPSPDAVPALRRFSDAIPFVLAAMVLAGVTLAAVQLAAPAELLSTDYGRVFLGKLVLVGVLLLLGAYNRWRLTDGAADSVEAKRQLVRTIGLEALLVMLIFGVVALWRFTPPPRALLAAAAEPAFVHIHTAEGMAELTLTPGHAGPLGAKIYVATGDFGPLLAKQVTLDLSNKALGVEPIERQAVLGSDGYWHVDGLTLPAGGKWQAEIDILVSDFKEIDLSDTIQVRP